MTMTINLDGVRPIRDRVIIRPDAPESQTRGGIIIPVTAQKKQQDKGEKKKASWGTVLAVGPGTTDNQGRFWPVEVVAGDRVLVNDASPKEYYKDPDGNDIYVTWHYACVALSEDTPVRQQMRKEHL